MQCVACCLDSMGFTVAEVEDTARIDYIQRHRQNGGTFFRCYNNKGGSFSNHSIQLNYQTGSIETAANDGQVLFWDEDGRGRAHSNDSKGCLHTFAMLISITMVLCMLALQATLGFRKQV